MSQKKRICITLDADIAEFVRKEADSERLNVSSWINRELSRSLRTRVPSGLVNFIAGRKEMKR